MLLESNNVLLETLPKFYSTQESKSQPTSIQQCEPVHKPISNSTASNNEATQNMKSSAATVASAVPESIPFQTPIAIPRFKRNQIFAVNNRAPELKYYFHIRIPKVAQITTKGMFVGSSVHTSYTITSEFGFLLGSQCMQLTVERRHSEFKALYHQLIKSFPDVLVPPLLSSKSPTEGKAASIAIATPDSTTTSVPANSSPTDSAVSNTTNSALTNTNESQDDVRSRQLCIWLQFVACIARIQESSEFAKFLSGEKQLPAPKNGDESTSSNASGVTGGTVIDDAVPRTGEFQLMRHIQRGIFSTPLESRTEQSVNAKSEQNGRLLARDLNTVHR